MSLLRMHNYMHTISASMPKHIALLLCMCLQKLPCNERQAAVLACKTIHHDTWQAYLNRRTPRAATCNLHQLNKLSKP